MNGNANETGGVFPSGTSPNAPLAPAAACPQRRWVPTAGALGWIAGLCLIDAPAPVLVPLLLASSGIAVWLATLEHSSRSVWRRITGRRLPPPLALFVGVMLVNLALQERLVDIKSQPFFGNLLAVHALLLAWAWLATPRSDATWREVHVWSWRLLALVTTIVITQAMVRDTLGVYLDVRLWLTGVPSRSGVEEGSEGLRPTSLFAEPSNHAIVSFLLVLLHRLTGPTRLRAAALGAISCLVSASGIGLLLALVLALDFAGRLLLRVAQRELMGPVLMAAAWLLSALLAWSPHGLSLAALDRIISPSTGYDPLAVRTFVPQRIVHFEPDEHLLGTGIANYASLDEGLTQYDSSFALGAYYQAGAAALAMLLWIVAAAWHRHSWAAAALVVTLLSTKMSLIAPIFWGLCMLLHHDSRCANLRRP